MTDKHTEEQTRQRLREEANKGGIAQHARPVIESICDDLKDQVFRTFEVASPHDHEALMALKLYLQALGDIRQALVTAIEKGRSARLQLKDLPH